MALAGVWQAATFNRPGHELFDYDVYAIAGDGCLMEGIGAEAASFAGHQKLSNLCWIYDDNKITIEGSTDLAFTEDVGRRFEGYGWAIQRVDDANDLDALTSALEGFKAEQDRPTMIIVKSIIAYGAPTKQGHHSAHGEPLGVEEIRGAKRFYGWPEDESFLVPDKVREHFAEVSGQRGADLRSKWDELFDVRKEYPELADHLDKCNVVSCPTTGMPICPSIPRIPRAQPAETATRRYSTSSPSVPWLIGGSSDLAPSNKSRLTFDGAGDFSQITGRVATCTSAYANTRPARSRTGWRSARSGPIRPGS